MFLKISLGTVLLSVFVISLLSGGLFSQDENYNDVEIARSQYIFARHMTNNIAEKLKLDNEQKKALISILLNYQDNLLNLNSNPGEYSEMVGSATKSKSKLFDQLVKNTNQQIIDILNPGQQGIYFRIKTAWWKDLNKKANVSKK